MEGDTYIVSAGPYCENLGSITLEWSEDGSKTLVDYQLIPIDQTLPEDQGDRLPGGGVEGPGGGGIIWPATT